MCNKRNYHTSNVRIDKCMKTLIENINWMLSTNDAGFDIEPWWKTIACCCGHGKYRMSIVVKDQRGMILELVSGKYISRSRNIYKRDKQGYYFIPEVV